MVRKEMIIFVMGLFFLFTSCEKIDGDSKDRNDNDSESITLKSTDAIIRGDSVFPPLGRDVQFWIETSFPSPVLDVILSKGNDVSVSELGVFRLRWDQAELSTMAVIAKDKEGLQYSKVYIVRAGSQSWNDDEDSPVRFISSIQNGSSFDIVFALHKGNMVRNKLNFAYVGTNAGWQWPVTIPSHDTNYRITSNNVLERVYDAYAPWIAVRMTNVPGNYRMGVGKYDASGKLVWGSFPGSNYALDAADPTLLYYTLHSNGNVTPN